MIERIETPGRGDAVSRSQIAGLFVLAGEVDTACEWGSRAAEEFVRNGNRYGAYDAAATLYVCGEPDQAVKVGREHGVEHICLDLVRAERDGDLATCDGVVVRLLDGIVSNRVPPSQASGQHPIHDWDWLELTYELRARLAGESPPSHADMLERAGLLGAGPSRRVVRLEAGGPDRFAVTAADGTAIEASIERSDPDAITIVLDPRSSHYLELGLDWQPEAQGYVTLLYTEPESSPQDTLPYQGADFGEAINAAADWLAGPDLYGRDGTWAARTLTEITTNLPVSAT